MDKFAFQPNKGAPDPVQKRLRSRKKNWNIMSRKFIPRLIAFKQALNGRAIPLFGLPGSNIKDPVPAEVANFLNQLATDFNWLVDEAGGIVQEQAEYSMHRQKSQKETRASIIEADAIIIESSNILSRFWSRISSLFSSDKFKHTRLGLLNTATRLFKNLVEFEDVILKKGNDNIPDIFNAFFVVKNNFNTFELMFERIQVQLTKLVSPPSPETVPTIDDDKSPQPKPISPSKPIPQPETMEPTEKLSTSINIDHLLRMNIIFSMIGLPASSWSKLSELSYNFKKEKNQIKKELIQDIMQETATKLLKEVREIMRQKYDIKIARDADLTEYSEAINEAVNHIEASSEINQMLIKNSGRLSKLINYYRHRYGLKDETSAIRMDLYTKVREIKVKLDTIMDDLESNDINIEALTNKVQELEKHFLSLKDPIELLRSIHFETLLRQRTPKYDPADQFFKSKFRKQVRQGY